MPASHSFVLTGRLLTFFERPQSVEDHEAYAFWQDGAIAVQDGKIVWRGDVGDLPGSFANWRRVDRSKHLVLPGFIDAHTHYPQMEVIGSYGAQLMEWLETYTFEQEARFSDIDHSREISSKFLDELIAHGVTTAAVYTTSHPASTDAFFDAAETRNMCMIAGKVMMDRNAPETILDTPQRAYDESKTLIRRWHKCGRLQYAITPRFAITSTPDQMAVAQSLLQEHPDCFVQTHLSENVFEIDETLRLFPKARDYTDVYEQFDLLGSKSLFGHCVHLSLRERSALADSSSVAVFCPSSNLFLGSGLFDYRGLLDAKVRVAYGSDVGAGTSYSMLATAADAYKICQLNNFSCNPLESFYGLTLGNARALSLESEIGTLEIGSDADLTVLDSRATNAMATRMRSIESLSEELFVLQTLGDDRAIAETYVAGVALKSSPDLSD
ncbi:MAG: guanine deaminase [Pseudomonadota bacterium]